MRATTLLKNLLGIKSTRVLGVRFDTEGIVCGVTPATTIPRCSGCGFKVRKVYDHRAGARRWRHLDACGMTVHLEYTMRRLDCRRCGVTTELVPWAAPNSWFTDAFERTVGYLAQASSKTVVAEMMRVGWSTVSAIIRRLVARLRDDDPLDGLTDIGIDELSYRKHHEYITVVFDHRKQRVVWAAPGKNAATLKAFFEALGAARCSAIKTVTIDMSKAYISAVQAAVPNARLVFDRFHVQRLAHDALDEVRRSQVRDVIDPDEKRALKHTRFPLQKNPWNLTEIETSKLAEVQRTNRTLYRAYLLKETLAAALDRRQPNVAKRLLLGWTSWASRSGLAPFAKVARTITAHLDGIIGYVATRLSNAAVEGTNGKIRTITRRSYGFHSATSLIAMIFLCCSGITLSPVHVHPSTHQT